MASTPTVNLTSDVTTEAITTAADVTTQAVTTTTENDQNNGMPIDGMSGGEIAGLTIGAIVAVCVIVVAIAMFLLVRHKKRRDKNKEKYHKTVKELKINQLPSPSEVEREELRPPERMPTKGPIEFEEDLESSTKHYQNVPESKYQNVDNDEPQPVYLEPQAEPKRLYTTAEGSEYYVVEDPGRVPKLPGRNDVTNQKQKSEENKRQNVNGNGKQKPKSNPNVQQPNQKTKTKTNNQALQKTKTNPPKPEVTGHVNTQYKKDSSSSSGSETDEEGPPPHSSKDYVNIKDQNIVPPVKHPKPKQLKETLIVDEVYENEEIPISPRSKTKR